MKALPLYRRFPRRTWTRMLGWYAKSPWSRPAISFFIKRYQVDLSELAKPVSDYRTLAEFFSRRLVPGARPLDDDPEVLLSPCDGVLVQQGVLTGGHFIQAKGQTYGVDELLALESDVARKFLNGCYWTIYLHPRDYHRVHAPASGKIVGYGHVPGTLYPVNPGAAERVPRLFLQNERVIFYLDTAWGIVAVVMVGALGVGSIALPMALELPSHRGRGTVESVWFRSPKAVARGEELGAFTLGSTVIVVAEASTATLTPEIVGTFLRMGRPLGRFAREEG
ncbi:MAG: archaetidylserine decarboxylase [Firmicutes bacterium]|nr:archaetidylserine decarboxylase [Bacillota bacterium]